MSARESLPDLCPQCRYNPGWRVRWRPKIDSRGEYQWEGKFLLLESFERIYCACSAKAVYFPIAGVVPEQCEFVKPPTVKAR